MPKNKEKKKSKKSKSKKANAFDTSADKKYKEQYSMSGPELTPPTDSSHTDDAENCPRETPPEEQSAAFGAIESGPTQMPPEAAASTSGAVGATWHNQKKMVALYSTNSNRNSWVYPTGLGWKKLADNSDSANVALTMLASHAREGDRTVNVKEEDDQKISEIYVW